jgi:hypothetical protein
MEKRIYQIIIGCLVVLLFIVMLNVKQNGKWQLVRGEGPIVWCINTQTGHIYVPELNNRWIDVGIPHVPIYTPVDYNPFEEKKSDEKGGK